MIETPLHPQLVHFPIALSVIAPFLTLSLFLLLRVRWIRRPALVLISVLHISLSLFSYYAMEAGEKEEEKVEQVVDKEIIHHHEENAESFFYLSLLAVTASLMLLFLPKGLILNSGFTLLLIMQAFMIYLVYETAGSGGKLIYEHGAAEVYYKSSSGNE